MPKRSAEDDKPGPGKRARTASSAASVTKSRDAVSHEVQHQQDLSTVSPAMLSDGTPKSMPDPSSIRRRMNPDSLAYRLGADLIKELEDLLTPGMTEMPPFSVRQEIQQRYKVDRRHIYDWFHNKGLRVSSSEKRNEQRAAKLKETRSMPDTRIQRRIRTHSERTTAPPPTQRCTSDAISSGTSTPILSGSSHPTPSPSGTGNFIPYEVACQMHRPPGYLSYPFGDFDSGVFPYHSFLAYSPSQNASHTPYPFPPISEYHGFPNTEPAKSADRTSDWISEQQKIPYTPGSFASPPLDSGDAANMNASETLDSLWLLGHEQALPQPQREAFYQSLSDVLPPACGIEESVGSYKAYMDQQTRGYYDRLGFSGVLPPAYEYPSYTPKLLPGFSTVTTGPTPYSVSYPRILPPGPLPTPPQATVQRTPVPGTSEFSNWLRFYGRSQAPSAAPSPSQTPSLTDSNTSSGSLLWPPDIVEGHTRRRSSSASMSLEISEILESPVLRSRQTTNVKGSHEAPLIDEEYFKTLFKNSSARKGLFSSGPVAMKDENVVVKSVFPMEPIERTD